MSDLDDMDLALQAAVFRRLVTHLRERTDVQNIDLMNLAGFCRNCLSNWMMEEAAASGTTIDKEHSREMIYGMPYDKWKSLHQSEAAAHTLALFDATSKHSLPE